MLEPGHGFLGDQKCQQWSTEFRTDYSLLGYTHTRAMGDDAPSPDFLYPEFFDQVLDCMECPPGLECSNLLVVFALEEESESGRRCTWSGWGRRHAIKGRRCEDQCTVNVLSDDAVGLFDRLRSEWETGLMLRHCDRSQRLGLVLSSRKAKRVISFNPSLQRLRDRNAIYLMNREALQDN